MFPAMQTKEDISRAIIALVLFAGSIFLSDRFNDIPPEIIAASTTLLAYIVGLFTDRTNQRKE